MVLRWEGTLEIEASQDRVWAGLIDPAILARCAGAEGNAREIGEYRWEVPARIAVGMFKLPVTLEIAMHELEAPSAGRLTITGTGPGAGLEGRSTVRLTSPPEAVRELRRAGFTDVAHVASPASRWPSFAKPFARYQHLLARRPR